MPWKVWRKPSGDRQLPHGKKHISFSQRPEVEWSDTPRSSWPVHASQTSSLSWVQHCATHTHKHTLTHTNCERILLRWICPHRPVQKHVWFKTHAFPYVYGNYNLHAHKQFSFRRLYLWLSVMENITLLLVNLGEFHIIRDVVMFSYPDVLCIVDNIFCRAVLQSWQNIIWECVEFCQSMSVYDIREWEKVSQVKQRAERGENFHMM